MALLFLLCFIVLQASGQSIEKCPDYKPVDDANFEAIDKGRWNVLRFYGYPPAPDESKASCIASIVTPTEDDNVKSINFLVTLAGGKIKNDTYTGVLVSPGIMDIDQEKEFMHSGIKMTVRIHAVHYLLYSNDEAQLVGSCNDHVSKKEFFQSASILSRGTSLSAEFVEKAEEIISSYGIATTFTDILHNDCKY